MTFEFDSEKTAANLAKHGIDFVEAQALWEDELRTVSPAQIGVEDRELVTGMIAGSFGRQSSPIVMVRHGSSRCDEHE